jgi:predicted TIM-barrel fold metal-dependent hydrolase
MEIVDARVHLNHIGANWQNTDPAVVTDYAIVTMDALGIRAVLIDEWAGWDEHRRHLPGYVLPNGAMRSRLPFSETAVALHPDRFGYTARIDPRDPEMEQLMANVRRTPGGLCLRIVPFVETGERQAFETGGFDKLFAAAQRHEVPLFFYLPAGAPLLEPVLRKFPNLQVILDHCGVDAPSDTPSRDARLEQLDEVISLAKYPNFALKWCHAPDWLSLESYPFRDLMTPLRRVIDAFTPQRVMWGSDHTQTVTHHSWAQAFYYLLDTDALSATDKEWILGRTVRTILRWPAPASGRSS